MRRAVSIIALFCFLSSKVLAAEPIVETIAKIKPAIVGVGIFTANEHPQNKLYGTGFVIGNGKYIVTNYHVLPPKDKLQNNQTQVVFSGTGKLSRVHKVKLVAESQTYDLAVLELLEFSLPALKLAPEPFIPEGSKIAFTGFPIGAVLGLYPVTHQGFISSITPVIVPAGSTNQLTAEMIKTLKDPYLVYQLDAIAYPGNSGSPVYSADSGEVIAVINKTFIQQSKEAALSNPSGITYAIPVKYLHQLLQTNGIEVVISKQ
ncbi:serine protease [Thalassomonas sp. M1454]|uniref:S1 family peptidase n=1 Tax=Thalassomonas sp. M1454 TaxID=2594477 RepID=UPI00117EBF8B|nr:serine protease [Thalassomonas sp. M1454]TRX57927.1 trypsin-like peptidase domain-containing protein [Thalassomonas sp. M1454]